MIHTKILQFHVTKIGLPLEFVEKVIELFKKKIPQEFIDYNSFE